MRRIEQRPPPPLPLTDSRALEARRAISAFLDLPEEQRESRRAPIDEKIYHSEPVRVALNTLFAGKCAYCETMRAGPMVVEQHRPTSNAGGGRKRLPHHYSWLAYDWENLLQVCQACSQRKRNLFPVRSGRAALKTPLSRVRAQESPQLLDPGYDRPERHLDFTLDGMCHARSKRGGATIGILDLNRPDLVEERRAAYQQLQYRIADGRDLRRVAEALTELDSDEIPFVGSMRILRHRLLSAIADRVSHFSFSFEDAQHLIESVLGEAGAPDVVAALQTLERPERGAEIATTPASPVALPFTPQIRRIVIENFRVIDRIEINMEATRRESSSAAALMLLGENATGKSTVLEAITLALVGADKADTLAKARDVEPDARRGGHPGPHGPMQVLIEFHEGPPAKLSVGPDGKFDGTREPRANVLAYGSRRYFKAGRRIRSRTGGPKGLFDPSWTLPHPDLWLEDLGPDRFPEIARALAEILSLPPPPAAFLKQDERGVYIVEGDLETPLSRHSEGYRSIFATAVDMLRGLMGGVDVLDAQGVVLIDEVETHLHPRWKMLVVSALRKALPRVQFILTTHDPLCLRGMGPGEVQVMVRDPNNRIGLAPDLPDVSGMRIDQILTSEHFGMQSTLDPDFQAMFDRYQTLLRESRERPDAAGEIDALRKQINERQRLGQTERERLMLEAIDKHLAIRVATGPVREQQDAALEAQLDDIWSEATMEAE